MTNFLYDSQQLSQITTETTYEKGIHYFKDNRVFECYLQESQLLALVEGSNPDLPYDVCLNHDENGVLHAQCDCESPEAVCKHAIATLLYFTNETETADQNAYISARETAIKDRIKRGKTEVKIKHISGHPCFGEWQAYSIGTNQAWTRTYTVHIRSLGERINYCTCPDLANNQLDTCKHIEAVLHQLSKQDKKQPAPNPVAFVFHTSQPVSEIRIQRVPKMASDLTSLVNRFFDVQGRFCAQLPNDFFQFSDEVFGREDISIGVDARQVVQKLVSQQTHQLMASKIREQIRQSEGRIAGINAQLYSYQIEGVAFLAANGRALLADDMGLGKTLQAIAAANLLMQTARVNRVLIVCPASLKHQWAREIEKFSGQETLIIQGNAEQRKKLYQQDKAFFILNYELVLRDLDQINSGLHPDLVILDEAQRIRNWRTKIAASIKMIHSRYAFVLTGTPLENRLEDLYSLMQMVDQHLLGPLWRYLNDYHITDERGKVIGYRNLSQLRERINPVMLRRNRSIVSDQLPGRITVRRDIEMTDQQKALHDSGLAAASRLAQIAKTRPLTPSEQNRMMAALQQSRMACNAAGLVDKETQGSPKLKELKALIEELCIEGGQKMVVFSQWHGMTTMVEEMLKKMEVGFAHLHGQVPTHKRGDLMEAFQQDPSIMVFISTDAGGTGLNLQNASVLINLDIPWNPAVLEQRNGRIHRLGQRKKVQIILLIATDSYEERVLQLVGNKQHLFNNVVNQESTEDVIGLSKKALASVIEELSGDLLPIQSKNEEEPAPRQQSAQNHPDNQDENDNAEDAQINEGIAQIQSHFGDRLQQVLAKGGGLIVIIHQLTPEVSQFVEQIGFPIPIAVIDLKTHQQLECMGDASPTANAVPARDVSANISVAEKWQTDASEKLNAAKQLLKQNLSSSVIALLSSAIGSYLSGKAGLSTPMSVDDAGVWLYSEALPKGLLTEDQAAIILRILSLRLASLIPPTLLAQSIDDAEKLLHGIS